MNSGQLTILVVEDERIIALAMEVIIKNLGHRVSASVASGEDALACLQRARPDLVVMDIHLKGSLDGIETARLIRAQGGPPVAYATAYTDPETMARALSTEPLAFLAKPVSPADIKALVQRLLTVL